MTRDDRSFRGPWPQLLAEWMVGHCVPADEQDALLGDLLEEYGERVRSGRRRWANLWYWSQLSSACGLAIRDHARRWTDGGWAGFEGVRSDVRYALRSLARRPGFTTMAALVMAVTIGLNTAMLSVVDGTLLTRFPFPDADRLRVIRGTWFVRDWSVAALSIPELRDFADRLETTGEIAIIRPAYRVGWTREGATEPVNVAFVTSTYFPVLGVGPAFGRTFTQAEDEALDASPVAILSHGFWSGTLGADSAVLGSSVDLAGRRFTIIGVMPEGYLDLGDRGLLTGENRATQIWLPLSMARPFIQSEMFESRLARQYFGVTRLRPGVTDEEVRRDIDRAAAVAEQEFPDEQAGWSADVWSLRRFFFGNMEKPVRILLAGAALVLLMGCVNVAAMVLVHVDARRRELAVRLALGAHRVRIVRQIITETLILAGLGGTLGVLLAAVATRRLADAFALGLPSFTDIGLGTGVLVASTGIVVLTGVVAGLVPGLRAGRGSASYALSGSPGVGMTRSRARYGEWIVTVQVACALVLLIGAALTATSLYRISTVPTGYDSEGLLTFTVDLANGAALPEDQGGINRRWLTDRQRRMRFAEQFVAELSRAPEVDGIGLAGPDPITHQRWHMAITPARLDPTIPENRKLVQELLVSPGALDVMGLSLIAGRDFDWNDRLRFDARTDLVTIIDEKTAETLWPDEDPIGKRFYNGRSQQSSWTVVGLVGNAKHRGRMSTEASVWGDIYVPYLITPWRFVSAVVRLSGSSSDALEAARRVLRDVDQEAVIYNVAMLEDRLRRQEAVPWFSATMMAIYASVTALMAIMGVYSVLACTVRERTRELAVRGALGAPQAMLLTAVLRTGLVPVVLGIGIGLAASWSLARVIESMLFAVDATAPSTYAAVGSLLLLVATMACLVPAVRAAHIDPITVLRSD